MIPSARVWLREPLLRFVVLGAALFLLHRVVAGGAAGGSREIVVSEARVEALAEGFARTWLRPPTAGELRGLVDDYVAEEVYYREAVALGLDRDDTVVRRRLRQKLEFLSEDIASSAAPSEAQLQAYFARHAARFAEPPRSTFRHVLFSRARRGDGAGAEAERALAELRAGRGPEDASRLGDPTLLPRTLASATPQDVAAAFGGDFASRLEQAPLGEWSGPIASDFGVHLVRVERRDAGASPAFGEVRADVLRAWQAEERRKASEAVLARLLARYEVRIERPLGEARPRPAPARGAAAP